MNSLILWLIPHLGAGLLLGVVLLALLFILRRASTTQRCWVAGVFLAAMAVLAPWHAAWWPEVRVPVSAPREAAPLVMDALPLLVNVPSPATTPRPVAVTTPALQEAGSTWKMLLLGLWAAGAGLILLRLLAGTWLWKRLWKQGVPAADVELPADAPKVEVRHSHLVATPMAAGRQILLPATWDQWTAEERTAALSHELAHVRHRDGFSRWMAELAAALHWPSPLVWLARRELRMAQEQRCDEAVLAAGVDAMTYGQLLMRCARERGSLPMFWPAPAAASMARPGQLSRRLKHLAEEMPAASTRRWQHLVWPVVLACGCLQLLHVRLVAAPAQTPAASSARKEDQEKAHASKFVTFDVMLIESDSGLIQSTLEKLTRSAGAGTRQLTPEQREPLLTRLAGEVAAKTTRYPRVATYPGRKVIISTVVTQPGTSLTLDRLGATGPLCVGTQLTLTPRIEADGDLRLEGVLALNGAVRDLGNGQWEHAGQRADIASTLPPQDSLVLGPLKPVDNGSQKYKHLWVLITPGVHSAVAGEQQQNAAKGLRAAAPKLYDLKSQSVQRVLTTLAQDAGIQFCLLPADPDAKTPTLDLQTRAAPFAALESLCAQNGLTLELWGDLWIAGTQAQWNHQAWGHAPEESAERRRLRGLPAQSYQFHQALLGDVLRFMATDSGVNFMFMPLQAETSQRLVSVRLEGSPFTVLEQVCDLNGLFLIEEPGVWRIDERDEDALPNRMALDPVAAQLRAKPPQDYSFHKAVLGDVLRYLIKDAGIRGFSVPNDSPAAARLVTFHMKASPFSVLETLCAANGLQLRLVDGSWYVKPAK